MLPQSKNLSDKNASFKNNDILLWPYMTAWNYMYIFLLLYFYQKLLMKLFFPS